MIDLVIVLTFILWSISNGLRHRKQASGSMTDYFLAGKSLRGWKAGTSMAATQFAADTPLLFVGLIATSGLFMLWQLWIYGIAFLLMGFLFAPCWRRAGVITDAEITELRYSGRGLLLLRGIKALYYGTLINCVVLAFVLVAAMSVAELFLTWHEWLKDAPAWIAASWQFLFNQVQSTGINLSVGDALDSTTATTNNLISLTLLISFTTLYSTTGGLRSVVATDVAQFWLALLATGCYGWIIASEAGGLTHLVDNVIQQYGDAFAHQHLAFTPNADDLMAPFFLLIGMQWLFQMNSDGTGYLAQRSIACESDHEATKAAIVFAWLQVGLRSAIWVIIGVGLLILFPFTLQDMAQADTFKASREATFLAGIDLYLPSGIKGLMLTGLLAALASTIDTHLNWGASYWSNDLYQRIYCQHFRQRTASQPELVTVARLSTFLIIALALTVMAQLGSIQEGWKLSLLFGAGSGGVLILRWTWERLNQFGELTALGLSLPVGMMLLHWFPDGNAEWIRLGLMAIISTSAAIIVSLITPATATKTLDNFYHNIKPPGFWQQTEKRLNVPAVSLTLLKKGLGRTGLGALSLFLALTGLVKLLLPLPDEHVMLPALLLGLSALLIPFWLPVNSQQQVTDKPGDQLLTM